MKNPSHHLVIIETVNFSRVIIVITPPIGGDY